MMSDALLARLGTDGSESREQLVEFFDTAFRFVSKERGIVLSEFIQAVDAMVARAESEHIRADGLRVAVLDLENGNGVLERRVDELLAELDAARGKAQSSELRCAELVVINEKQTEGIAAFREKVKGLKSRLVESNAVTTQLEAEGAAAKAQIVALGTLCSDIRTTNVLLDQRLVMVEREAFLRSKSLTSVRLGVALRQLATCRRDLAKARSDWSKWYKRTASIPDGRCGCVKSIRCFKRTGIDLDWIQAEAERASKGFERELKETAEDFRKQASVVRKERDDALADNEVYIDQVLTARQELRCVQQSFAAAADELAAMKAELARRIGLERFVRIQVLIGADGREKICPVPTMDGVLVPVLDVYRWWMAGGGGEGLDFRFECPVSGARGSAFFSVGCASDIAPVAGFSTSLAPAGMIKLVYQLAGLFGVALTLPFRFQLCGAGQWFDFPFIDQLEIASRMCSLVALSQTVENLQFPVLGATALFELHLTDSFVTMRLCEVVAKNSTVLCREVRMVDVGDFFLGAHLKFADGAAVQ